MFNFLSGWRTVLGGITLILSGLGALVASISCMAGMPVEGVECGSITTAIAMIGGGFVAIGIGGKMDKQTSVVANPGAVDVPIVK